MPQPAAPAAPNPAGEPAASTIPVDADILAAVNGALAAGTAPAVDHHADLPLDAEDTDAAPAGDAPAPDAAAPADPAASPDAPAADAAAVPAGDTPTDAPAADPKPAADPPPADAKPSDQFGELPADAKAETKERFGKLKDSYDSTVAELAQARAQTEQWNQALVSTGATPEQFGSTLGYLADINSGDPARLDNAYNTLLGELTAMAKALGKELPGVHDPLEAYPDLQNIVDLGGDRDAALKVAAERTRIARLEEGRRLQAEQNTVAVQHQEAANAELARIADWSNRQKAADPLFAQKVAILQPTIETVIAELPPQKWLPKIAELVAKVQVAAPAPVARPAAPRGPVVPDPVRGGNPMSASSQVAKEPGNVSEAVNAALAAIGPRR